MLAACVLLAWCLGCTTRYCISIKAVPGEQYDVLVDNQKLGRTSAEGIATVTTDPKPIIRPVFLEIKNESGKYGSLQLDYNGVMTRKTNVHDVRFGTGDIQKCSVTFLLDSSYRAALEGTPKVRADAPVKSAVVDSGTDEMRVGAEDGQLVRNMQDIITTPQEALPVIKRGQNRAIAGTVLFFGALAIDYGVMTPWANAVANKFSNSKTHDDSANAASEALLVLVADVPIGVLRTIGPTIACAGASRAYGAYRDGVDHSIPDILVWKPYIAGWVLGAIGGVCSTLGGLSQSKEVTTVGAVLSLGQEITWGWATIWSLVYSSKKMSMMHDKGFVIFPTTSPGGSSGFSMMLDY